MTVGKDGNIVEIQRGDKSPPVLVLDPTGHLLRFWGMGQYTIPHNIRLAGTTYRPQEPPLVEWCLNQERQRYG